MQYKLFDLSTILFLYKKQHQHQKQDPFFIISFPPKRFEVAVRNLKITFDICTLLFPLCWHFKVLITRLASWIRFIVLCSVAAFRFIISPLKNQVLVAFQMAS